MPGSGDKVRLVAPQFLSPPLGHRASEQQSWDLLAALLDSGSFDSSPATWHFQGCGLCAQLLKPRSVVYLVLTLTCCVTLGKLPPFSGPLPGLPFVDVFTSNFLVVLFAVLCFILR